MNQKEVERLIITSSLLYAAYTAWTCPCGDDNGKYFLSCHLPQFYIATTVPIAIAAYVNSK